VSAAVPAPLSSPAAGSVADSASDGLSRGFASLLDPKSNDSDAGAESGVASPAGCEFVSWETGGEGEGGGGVFVDPNKSTEDVESDDGSSVGGEDEVASNSPISEEDEGSEDDPEADESCTGAAGGAVGSGCAPLPNSSSGAPPRIRLVLHLG